MATNVVLVNSGKNLSADTIQAFYTAPSTGLGTIITAFTATNNTSSNQSYKAYIYAASGLLLDAVTPRKIIIRDKFDPGSGIVNHLIPAGGTLRMESSAADTIAFRVSGKEL